MAVKRSSNASISDNMNNTMQTVQNATTGSIGFPKAGTTGVNATTG